MSEPFQIDDPALLTDEQSAVVARSVYFTARELRALRRRFPQFQVCDVSGGPDQLVGVALSLDSIDAFMPDLLDWQPVDRLDRKVRLAVVLRLQAVYAGIALGSDLPRDCAEAFRRGLN